jgi:hypothetical protein
MSAATLLQDLEKRGVRFAARAADLVIEGPADALTDELVSRLRACKSELLALLQSAGHDGQWTAADWQAYFDERAGVREHDGRLPRAEAERLAFEDAVAHWLRLNPASASNPRHGCIHCGRSDDTGNTLLPVLAPDGHVWVHNGCWEAWHSARTRLARLQLKEVLQLEMRSGDQAND